MTAEYGSGKPLRIAKIFQIAAIVAIFIFTNVLFTLSFFAISEVALILSFPTNKRWQQLPQKITESSNVY